MKICLNLVRVLVVSLGFGATGVLVSASGTPSNEKVTHKGELTVSFDGSTRRINLEVELKWNTGGCSIQGVSCRFEKTANIVGKSGAVVVANSPEIVVPEASVAELVKKIDASSEAKNLLSRVKEIRATLYTCADCDVGTSDGLFNAFQGSTLTAQTTPGVVVRARSFDVVKSAIQIIGSNAQGNMP